jgi:ribose transport system substrate-binding protein
MTARSIDFRFVALLAAMIFLFGCNRGPVSPSSTQDSTETNNFTIAVIPKSIGGEFWETVEEGVRQAAQELDVVVKWEGPSLETEIAEQNKVIENMVNLGVDGMALAPLNNRTMRESVENVVAAGIPVVIFDSAVDGDKHVSYVATDNTSCGLMAAEHIRSEIGAKHVRSELDPSKKRLLLLRYIQGTASTEQRSQGFLDAVQKAGFEVLADPYCDDATPAGAKKTATNTLERFVQNNELQLDGMFATNLHSTVGLLEALKDLRKSGVKTNVVFVGFDTSPELIKELQAENIDGLVAQDPRRMGYLAVETTVKHLRGEKVEPRIDTGAQLVTRDRLNEPAIRKLVGLE